MLKSLFFLIIILLIIVGCSSTYIVKPDDSENYSEKINSLSKIYMPLIKLSDGKHFYANSIHIEKDTLYIQKYKKEAIPLELVSSMKLRDVVRGFVDGAFMGIPIGLAATFISLELMGDCHSGDFCGYYALLVGGIIYVATLIVNGIYSGNKTFIFQRNKDNSFSRIK